VIKGDEVCLGFFEANHDFIFLGAGQSVFAFVDKQVSGSVVLIVPEHRFKNGEVIDDLSKDVLCDAYIASKGNPYLPRIEFVGSDLVCGHPEINGRYSKIYTMKYYRDLVREDNPLWLEMKQLHKVRSDGKFAVYDAYEKETKNSPSLTFLGNEAAKISVLLNNKNLNITLKSALMHLYEALVAKNRPGLTFEFNLRNVGVDENANLILRDPVYDSSITVKIKEDRKIKE